METVSKYITLDRGIEDIHGIYCSSCINCGGPADDVRLSKGLPCDKCLPKIPNDLSLKTIYNELRSRRRLRKGFIDIYNLDKRLEEFSKLFKKALDSKPWSAQRTWAKRVFKGISFSIVAPTGVGKTLFGIMMSLYISGVKKWGKSYILVPTTPLVKQVYQKICEYADKIGINVNVIRFHSKMRVSEKREFYNKLINGDFDILVSTNKFLSTRFDDIKNNIFKFIQVDDVDAILRSSRNIERILRLLGFDDETIKYSMEEILLKRRLVRIRDPTEREEIIQRIQEINKFLSGKRGSKNILIVSSATGRPRGTRVKLFRELLGFEIGLRSETLRNIYDVYQITTDKDAKEILLELIKKLGNGGLVYVPVDKGIEYAEEIADYLRSNEVKADVFASGRYDVLDKFLNRELDVIVGVAIYYGVMVRGLDYPERIRYAIFLGTPRFRFSARFDDPNPIQMSKTLTLLRDIIKEDKGEIDSMIRVLNRIMKTFTITQYKRILEVLKRERAAETKLEFRILDILEYIRDMLSRDWVREGLKKHPDVEIEEKDGEFYLVIPDVMTYIQASGRTSRLYAGGITKGLSIVLEDREKLIKTLIRRIEWIFEEIKWYRLDEVNLEKIVEEIDEDREMVRKVRTGEIKKEIEDPVKSALLIVESPNKAKTIARFFGRPSVRRRDHNTVYEVTIGNLILMITASGGHIYDLITYDDREPRDGEYHGVKIVDGKFIPIYHSIRRCLDCGYQFASSSDKCPKCGSKNIVDSMDRVRFLRDLALEVDEVLIGTDPDTEGEKIGWDTAMLLRPYTKNLYRIEFHEVTRRAVLDAIKNKRGFDKNLVEAQIVRRIEDRWIGFELSHKLVTEFRDDIVRRRGKRWWGRYSKGGWSAGRVQTPVLGWIKNRWSDAKKSVKEAVVYEIPDPYNIRIEIPRDELPLIYRARIRSVKFRIEASEPYVEEVNPPPPYTTNMLIEDANRIMKLGADDIMRIAQDLFESGLITYHRTDSTRVSDAGIGVARTYIYNKFGGEADKIFKPRKWSEAGAHECIRPTKPIDTDTLITLILEGEIITPTPLKKEHYRLYSLIFNRFMASQASPAKLLRQDIKVYVGDKLLYSEKRTVDIIEEGFIKLNPHFITVKKLVKPTVIKPNVIDTDRKIFLIPGYTQGDVIRIMKEKNIGRPSTYAKIIKTLLDRRYVVESAKAKWLMSSEKGDEVYNFLITRYRDLVSEERTRLIERYMLEIEEGYRDYIITLRELYDEINRIAAKEFVTRVLEETYRGEFRIRIPGFRR